MAIPTRSRVAVAVLVIGQLAAAALLSLGYVRVRWMLLVVVGVFGFLAFRVWRAFSRRERMMLVASVGLPLLVVFTLTAPSAWDMGRAAIPVLAGWTVPLAIMGRDPESFPRPRIDLKRLLAVLVVFAAALWLAFRPPGHHPFIIDELLYLMQSQHMSDARFMRPLRSDLAPFFLINQSYSVPGFINGQYPPGWPLVLSLAPSFRAAWFLLFGVYVLMVGATYAFGRAVAGARTGLLAAILVSIAPAVLDLSTTFYSHVFEAALALIAGTLMLGGVNAPHGRRTVAWMLAGLTLGFATIVRPLTGVALAAALWLWVFCCARGRRHERRRPRLSQHAPAPSRHLSSCCTTTLQRRGHLSRFGYDLARHGLHAMGFGRRGFVEYNAIGVPIEHAFAFGPTLAIRSFDRTCLLRWRILSRRAPSSFRLRSSPGASASVGVGYPSARSPCYPLAYAFYFYNRGSGTDRFYFELFRLRPSDGVLDPPLGAKPSTGGSAGCLVRRHAPRRFRSRLHSAPARGRAFERRGQWSSSCEPNTRSFWYSSAWHVPEAPPTRQVSLIQLWGIRPWFSCYGYNLYDFPSDVVVVRDLGERDTVAVARFPGRYNVLLSVRRGSDGEMPLVSEAREFDPRAGFRAP